MCGINGFTWEDKDLIRQMNKVIRHRGPDDSGFFLDRNISLGHQRLSIIDLSAAGKQPMHNEDETVWVTFNGELYNYKELRKKLEEKGHRFFSNTDTEVIVHAYEAYGYDCVKLFNGMFAFGLYDTKKRILFLARDRLGIKPLYYYHHDNKLIFSSEIKALLQHKGITRSINPRALHDYLSFRAVTLSETMFEGIKKLKPGQYLVFHNYESFNKEKAYQLVIRTYWDLAMQPDQGSEAQHAGKSVSLTARKCKEKINE